METTEYRIYGPPGTGKTTMIADQVGRFVERFGGDQVSVCSLTRTAVREIERRSLPIESENLSTLHARCKRALGEKEPADGAKQLRQFARDCPTYATEECISLPRATDDDDVPLAEKVMGGGSVTLMAQSTILRQKLIPQTEWPVKVSNWYRVWREWCHSKGIDDFTGWLETALEVKPLPPQQIVFVDEAQDHTPLQLAVIRSWATPRRVLVGDDDQNLYEWSGSVPQAFLSPPLPESQEWVLNQSHRVPKAVHRLAARWIESIPARRRRQKEYLPRDEEGAVRDCGWDWQTPTLPPTLNPEDGESHMILATCSYMLQPTLDTLRRERIPFHNPFRRKNLAWNPIEPIRSILDHYLAKEWTPSGVLAWTAVLRARQVAVGGSFSGLEEALSKWKARQPVTVADISPFIQPQMLSLFARRSLSPFRHERKIVPGQWEYVLDLYDKGRTVPTIIVGTVHSVKGGEADNVYLAPDISPAAALDSGENFDRTIRTFYVAMTRARKRLFLCQEATRNFVVIPH